MKDSKGQVVIEYVLILFIAISLGVILSSKLISRSSSDPTKTGIIIKSWNSLLKTIGYDLPDCSGQSKFDKAQCN